MKKQFMHNVTFAEQSDDLVHVIEYWQRWYVTVTGEHNELQYKIKVFERSLTILWNILTVHNNQSNLQVLISHVSLSKDWPFTTSYFHSLFLFVSIIKLGISEFQAVFLEQNGLFEKQWDGFATCCSVIHRDDIFPSPDATFGDWSHLQPLSKRMFWIRLQTKIFFKLLTYIIFGNWSLWQYFSRCGDDLKQSMLIAVRNVCYSFNFSFSA